MKIARLKDNIAYITYDKVEKLSELEVVQFNDAAKTKAVLLSANEQGGHFAILSENHRLKVGDVAKSTEKTFSVDIPKSPIGKVFSYAGVEIPVGKELVSDKVEVRPIYELEAPILQAEIEPEIIGITERGLVNRPLKTGLVLVDSTIPIGRGQRELIVGDRQTGKTAIALDTIISQKGEDVICIYNMIGGKAQDIVEVYEQLRKTGALDYTLIVASTSSDAAIKLWLSPYVATVFAEAFRDEGRDVLIVYDNLTTHAKAYRSFNLLMGTNPGREAYPGDVFYIHSRLLERAGQYNEAKKNGSITALPIVQTEKGNISAYIPTNTISITDGQIFTSVEMFNTNIRPAVNINVSVSRVGSNAQTKYMKDVSSSLKSLIAQHANIKVTFTSEAALSPEKKVIYRRGELVSEVFKQKNGYPYAYELEWVFLVMMKYGFFDDFKYSDIGVVKNGLVNFAKKDNTARRFMAYIKNLENKNYQQDMLEYFAKIIFVPFVKWVWLILYKDDQERAAQYKIKYLNFETLSFADVSLERQDYEMYSSDGETDVDFVGRKQLEKIEKGGKQRGWKNNLN